MIARCVLILLAASAVSSCSLFGDRARSLSEWVAEGRSEVGRQGLGAADAERVYFYRAAALRAYARSDGERVWHNDDARLRCNVVSASGGRVFCPGDALRAFKGEDGETLWTYTAGQNLALAESTADEERAYAGTLSEALAVDAETGLLSWRRGFAGAGWLSVTIRSMARDGADLLVAMDANYSENGFFSSSVVVALDPATGEERWRFEDGGPKTDKSIGSLTAWEGLVLYSDGRDEVVAFDRESREVVWRFPADGLGFLGTRRAPEVADGVAYWATGDNRFYAADARTGERVWSVEPEFGSYVNHVVCGPVVLGNNSALTVVRRSDGDVRRILFEDELVGQLAVADGFAYVSTEAGVYALDCEKLD